MTQPPRLHKERLFRETPGVHFSDIGVSDSNGLDLVVHKGFAVSPNDELGEKRFYIHQHQTDNNRCIQGARVFELVATEGQYEHPHYLVMLYGDIGALEIPPRVYHRSTSCSTGSILLNHAVRDEFYCEEQEFNPTAPSQDPKLAAILEENCPVYVNGTKGEIEFFLETGSITGALTYNFRKSLNELVDLF